MKKKIIISFAASLLIALILCARVGAEDYIEKYREYTDEGKSVSVTEFLTGERAEGEESFDEIEKFYASLSDELKDKLPSPTDDASGAAEKLGASYFIGLIFDSIKGAVSKHLAPLAVFAALAVISYIIRSLSPANSAGASDNAIRAAVCICTAASGVISFEAVSSFLTTLAALADASIPACIALLVSSGRPAASGVCAAFVSGVCAVTEKIYSSALLPMLAAATALVYAESLFRGVRPAISSFIRKAAVWIAVATATVSSFIFGVQSLLANASDTAAAKTVKFALGASIPYVGGALGDSVSAISAGVSSVKSVFGVTLLAAIFVLLLTPFASLIIGKLSLSAACALCGVLGLSGEEKMFSDLSCIASALIALCAAAAASFGVIISVMISYGAVV